jgi:hypothetical protein
LATATKRKFKLGQVVVTAGAIDAFLRNRTDHRPFVKRHQSGDWGDIAADDVRENVCALVQGLQIMSAYTLQDGTRLLVITEGDRSATTVLLPQEY